MKQIPKFIRDRLYDPKSRKRKGRVPPHLKRFLFKKGRRREYDPRSNPATPIETMHIAPYRYKGKRVWVDIDRPWESFIGDKSTLGGLTDEGRFIFGPKREFKRIGPILEQPFVSAMPEVATEDQRLRFRDEALRRFVKERFFDPRPRRGLLKNLGLRGQARRTFLAGVRPPKRWFEAMKHGIEKGSDVANPAAIVGKIWYALTPAHRRDIKARELAGKPFVYDPKSRRSYALPLPMDNTHRGGVIRVVKPFNLAEAQLDVSPGVFKALERTGIFQHMRRQDGTIGLVKRAKSNKGNVNIFIDRRR